MQAVTKKTLDAFQLRQTDCRHEVLLIFSENNFALSHHNLESRLSEKFDRVTIYRTLKTFLEKGIIHKVLDDEGGMKYALCKQACNHQQHRHDHVHFKCTACGNTTCLESIRIPLLALPTGYIATETSLLVQGLCIGCNH